MLNNYKLKRIIVTMVAVGLVVTTHPTLVGSVDYSSPLEAIQKWTSVAYRGPVWSKAELN